MSSQRFTIASLGFALLLAFSATTFAQLGTAGISGLVSDTNGAAVPQARVFVKNKATLQARETTTSGEGIYTFQNLSPATYEVRVEATNFAPAVVETVTLNVVEVPAINVTLSPAGTQGTKAPPKQETAVHAGANGAGGATSSAKPTASFPPSYESKAITFTPGFRLQVRYIHDTASGKNEFFVARLRLKAKGELFHTVRYYTEYKFDTLGRSGRDPVNGFENAWLEYSIARNLAIRGGLYDVPLSRNALTSDSKLLFVDRSLIKDTLTSFGFADNTIGLLGHGRPFKGRFEYSAGIFNNERFRKFRKIGAPGANSSAQLMPAGRVVYHFLDPAPPGGYGDYQSSYVGKGKRLSIGANSAYLRKARDPVNEFNLLGWGTDVFFSNGPFSAEAEYDQLRKKLIGSPDTQMDGWYAQAGYLVRGRVEFAARHQQLDPNASVSNNQLRWTSLGSNIYFRKHNVKLQLDYTFRRGPGQIVKTDVLQIQMQVDY